MTLPPRLYLSHDAELDWLMGYEFGRVDDAQPPDCWRVITEHFAFLHDSPDGRVVGFKVLKFSEFDPEETGELWGEPRFDAPLVGLANASAGEVVLAARTFFNGRDSLNRVLFGAATQASGDEAVTLWRQCLEAGDAMAHFALGYTLHELGRHAEAYRHLRHYTEIAPHGSWNWCWYGYAAEAVGELAEARRAYRRAIELTDAGDHETDAPDRLARIAGPAQEAAGASPDPVSGVVLWGDALPELGRRRVDALSEAAALGITAGAKPKSYRHTDPNEDAVAVVQGAGSTLLVCADGHNGMASTRAAVEAILDRWGDHVPLPGDVSDDELVEVWHQAGEAVIAAGAAAGQPESRTTLIVAIVAPGEVRWAAMGDSVLAIVPADDGQAVELLGKRRSHFVGYPMTVGEVAERLRRGHERIEDDAWLVAATDGLTDFVRDLKATLARAASGDVGASRLVERLIDAACKGGAGDNVAVAAVRVPDVARTSASVSVASNQISWADRVRGSILGGAVGDALGAPVEFDSIGRIRKRFGPDGITDFAEAYGRVGPITDDTQMTLFTAEGLIRALVRGKVHGLSHVPGIVDHAYARWLATQGERSPRWDGEGPDGWLISVRGLHDLRAPGNTCLSALRSPRMGTIDEPLNDSKGCGGVMRIAPVGLMGHQYTGDLFDLGCEVAALTHGHPSGYLSAGALAELISGIVQERPLEVALEEVQRRLIERPRHEETSNAVRAARALASSDVEPGPDAIATLGAGWVAEEALAISVYCALRAESFEHGVRLAVNHSGDSDSTGAITGSILGALLGADAIPGRWIEQLELGEEISQLINDWIACFAAEPTVDIEEDEEWWERYPGR